VIFYLLTGQNPSGGKSVIKIFAEKMNGKYLTFDDVDYSCSELLKDLYKKMMEHAPGERIDIDVLIQSFEYLNTSNDPSFDTVYEVEKKKISGHRDDTTVYTLGGQIANLKFRRNEDELKDNEVLNVLEEKASTVNPKTDIDVLLRIKKSENGVM